MKKNLNYANKLMHDLCEQDRRFTPVTNKDYDLFNSYFKNEKHTYGNSWTYVTQGMYGIGPEGLGYKYYDGNNLSAVCVYPKIEHPEINVFYWVRPMGESILSTINTFSHSLLKKDHLPTYVKKIFPEQFAFLQKNGFSDTSKFPWHSSCPSEDDTFPEQIFDVKKTVQDAKTLPRKNHLKKSYIRTLQLEKKYSIHISNSQFQSIAWNVSSDFFTSHIIKKEKRHLSNSSDYYNMIFHNLESKTVVKNIVYVNDKPLGYYVLEKQNTDFSSLYGLIVLRNKLKFLVDYLLLYIMDNCQTAYLNMGGSEDSGINQFKKKYYPKTENKMFWATLTVS